MDRSQGTRSPNIRLGTPVNMRGSMARFLGRLWAGIVGAVAGASLGMVAATVLLMLKMSLDIVLWVIGGLALLGGIVAFAFANQSPGGK